MAKKPIVYAYGIRWEQKDLALLPEFRYFRSTGIYVLYWKGLPVYVGRTKGAGELKGRIGAPHTNLGPNDWDSFSWFVISQGVSLPDVEALCITAFSDLKSKEIRTRKPSNEKILGANMIKGTMLLEKSMWRNYEVLDGKLSAYNAESKRLLKKSSQIRCGLKHPRR